MVYQTWPQPATVVFVFFAGVFRHKGIVSDRWYQGKPMVIANSAGTKGVAEIPWESFTKGRTCYKEEYATTLSPQQVLWNARRLMATNAGYDLGLYNCEQFVALCHAKKAISPQVIVGVGLAALGLMLLAVNS